MSAGQVIIPYDFDQQRALWRRWIAMHVALATQVQPRHDVVMNGTRWHRGEVASGRHMHQLSHENLLQSKPSRILGDGKFHLCGADELAAARMWAMLIYHRSLKTRRGRKEKLRRGTMGSLRVL